MIIKNNNYMVISKYSNKFYWEEGHYPDWTPINTFRYYLQESGKSVEPHYHDCDEFWLFAAGRGEAWLNDQNFDVTPNTVIYNPMGSIHRFQMFTENENVAIVTRLEKQKRPRHILVEEDGPPVPTVPGFVVRGPANNAPFADPGPRCPLSEFRVVNFTTGEKINEECLPCNENWVVLEGTIRLSVQNFEAELS